jgi:hypothetical protein
LVSAILKAEKNGFSNIILNSILNETDLDNIKKSFVTAAFYGVLERKLTLENILNKFLKKPVSKAPPYTAAVLKTAAYQILFMEKIPISAAVNEAVKLMKKSKEKIFQDITCLNVKYSLHFICFIKTNVDKNQSEIKVLRFGILWGQKKT